MINIAILSVLVNKKNILSMDGCERSLQVLRKVFEAMTIGFNVISVRNIFLLPHFADISGGIIVIASACVVKSHRKNHT